MNMAAWIRLLWSKSWGSPRMVQAPDLYQLTNLYQPSEAAELYQSPSRHNTLVLVPLLQPQPQVGGTVGPLCATLTYVNSTIHEPAGLVVPGRSVALSRIIPETPISREWEPAAGMATGGGGGAF